LVGHLCQLVVVKIKQLHAGEVSDLGGELSELVVGKVEGTKESEGGDGGGRVVSWLPSRTIPFTFGPIHDGKVVRPLSLSFTFRPKFFLCVFAFLHSCCGSCCCCWFSPFFSVLVGVLGTLRKKSIPTHK